MAASSKDNVPQWSKWQIALIIGAPVAVGVAYWYYFKKNKKKDKPPTKKNELAKSKTEPKFSKASTWSDKDSGISSLLSPEDPYEKAKAFKNQGNRFYKEGSFDKAVEYYTSAISVCPEDSKMDIATFYQNRAAAYEVLRNYPQVIADCTKSLELNKHYIKSLHRRAKAYEIVGDLQKCLEDMATLCIMEGFENRNSLQMTDRVLKNLSKEKAKEIFKNRKPCLPSKHFIRHYFVSFSEDPVAKLVEEYKKHMDEKNLSDLSGFRLVIHKLAVEKYEDVIPSCTVEIERQGPDMPEALLVRATFKLLCGQVDESLSDLEQLLLLESVDVKVRVNGLIKIGAIKVQSEQLDEATVYFDKALELDLNNADVYHHRGQVALLMERMQDALADMDKSIMLNPNFSSAIAQKCFVQYRCGIQFNDEQQKAAAFKGFEELVEKFPRCSESCYLYAQILSECGRFEESEKYFRKAGELDPEDPNVYVHLGLLVVQWKQDMDACVELLKKAIELDDKCHFGLETLGSIEVQRGNLHKGLELFNKALDIANTESELAHLLSLLKAAEAQAKAAENLGVDLQAHRGES